MIQHHKSSLIAISFLLVTSVIWSHAFGQDARKPAPESEIPSTSLGVIQILINANLAIARLGDQMKVMSEQLKKQEAVLQSLESRVVAMEKTTALADERTRAVEASAKNLQELQKRLELALKTTEATKRDSDLLKDDVAKLKNAQEESFVMISRLTRLSRDYGFVLEQLDGVKSELVGIRARVDKTPFK